jgi:hypothetical protein
MKLFTLCKHVHREMIKLAHYFRSTQGDVEGVDEHRRSSHQNSKSFIRPNAVADIPEELATRSAGAASRCLGISDRNPLEKL